MPDQPLTAEPDRGPNILGLLADLGYATWILGRTALRRQARQHGAAVVELAARRAPVGYLVAFRAADTGEPTPVTGVITDHIWALDALAVLRAEDPGLEWRILTIRDDHPEAPHG